MPSFVFTSFIWWCTINASVSGDPRHFLLYGRDAWEGTGAMRCYSRESEIRHNVKMSFFSKNPGFGAQASSNLQFNITLWTNVAPGEISVTETVPGLVDGSLVHWQISSATQEVTASVWTNSATGVAQSLSLGTMVIKTLPKVP